VAGHKFPLLAQAPGQVPSGFDEGLEPAAAFRGRAGYYTLPGTLVMVTDALCLDTYIEQPSTFKKEFNSVPVAMERTYVTLKDFAEGFPVDHRAKVLSADDSNTIQAGRFSRHLRVGS
jgi:hypothetical protein